MHTIHIKLTIDCGKGETIEGDGNDNDNDKVIDIDLNDNDKNDTEDESLREGRNLPKETLVDRLVNELGEPENKKLFWYLVNRYSESIILNALNTVIAFPQAKIKKSKGALFNYLVKKHGEKSK